MKVFVFVADPKMQATSFPPFTSSSLAVESAPLVISLFILFSVRAKGHL